MASLPKQDNVGLRIQSEVPKSLASQAQDMVSLPLQEHVGGHHFRSEVPKSFVCPICMSIMVDPVLDGEGNTYEKGAIQEWLKLQRISPISRQPLNERLLVPNIALRDTIHEFMGPAWVAKRQAQVEQEFSCLAKNDGTMTAPNNQNRTKHASKYRAKIDTYLELVSHEVGLNLRLNRFGICSFGWCNSFTVFIEVPETVSSFFIYTVELVPFITDRVKDLLLELNYLQGETRGGSLSVKKARGNSRGSQCEIVYSYTDRVNEISAKEFRCILENFLGNAILLQARIHACYAVDSLLCNSSANRSP